MRRIALEVIDSGNLANDVDGANMRDIKVL